MTPDTAARDARVYNADHAGWDVEGPCWVCGQAIAYFEDEDGTPQDIVGRERTDPRDALSTVLRHYWPCICDTIWTGRAEMLERALRTVGFEPDFNTCASCGHSGGDHDLGNWCLLCPRPDVPARPIDGRLAAGWCFYSSMTHSEKWEHGVAAVLAALAKPVPKGGA